MDQLLGALGNLLSVFKDPVNVVLLLVCVAEGYFIKVSRSENRQDRANMVSALEHNTEALNGVRNILAAMTGKAT